jgi:hypothetical protein
MSHRAMTIVVASFLFATQCYAETVTATVGESSSQKQTTKPGGTAPAGTTSSKVMRGHAASPPPLGANGQWNNQGYEGGWGRK